MNILNIFKKSEEQIRDDLVHNIVELITNNLEYRFSYKQQAEILKLINEKVLDKKRNKRNKFITEAREIQNSIKKIETNE